MNALAGTGGLVRLAARRDRIMLPAWLAVFVLMAASSAAATIPLFPTVTSRVVAAEGMNATQSLVALYGRIYDTTSVGALALVKMGGIGAALVGVVAILVVIRHTRAEEEAGRLELVGATRMGRHAPLAAALAVAAVSNVLLAVLTALALIAAGLPAGGSFAFGAAWGGVGMAFAAIAAVCAQLAASRRTAVGLSLAVLGAVYLLRAVGDTAGVTGPGWLTWLSPIGWGQQFRPFAGDRWWVLLITLGFAVAAAALAHLIAARRDLGGALLHDRPGRERAGGALRGPFSLAWRLQRGSFLAWAGGFAVLGLLFGNIAAGVGGLLDSPAFRDLLARLGGARFLTDAFLATTMGILAMIASAYGIQAAARMRGEESGLHAEPVLATATSRWTWMGGHVAVALLGSGALMAVAGAGAGLAHAARVGDPGQFWRVLGAALAQVPAVWVVAGLTVAVFGLAPRAVSAAWAVLVGCFLISELGTLLELDDRIMGLSPFTHVPKLPGGAAEPLPFLVLTAVALAFTAVGMAAFRRRDVG